MRHSGILLLGVLGLTAFCGEQAGVEGRFDGSLALMYENGYVLGWDDAFTYKALILYRADAKPLYSVSHSGPDGHRYFVWAADSDGLAVRAYHDRHFQGRIDLLDPAGIVIRSVDTGSYEATRLTFAPDHSIWTVGYIYPHNSSSADFNVVRHYARTGEKLGEAVPWSQIEGENNAYTALQGIIGASRLFAASDRIGFVALSNWGNSKWVEVAFSGAVLGQYNLGSYDRECFSPHAMTANGNVYGQISNHRALAGYGVLDRAKGGWVKVTDCPEGLLIGADGDRLVFAERTAQGRVLHRVDVDTVKEEPAAISELTRR
jgi:hypothetical protein